MGDSTRLDFSWTLFDLCIGQALMGALPLNGRGLKMTYIDWYSLYLLVAWETWCLASCPKYGWDKSHVKCLRTPWPRKTVINGLTIKISRPGIMWVFVLKKDRTLAFPTLCRNERGWLIDWLLHGMNGVEQRVKIEVSCLAILGGHRSWGF